MSQRLTAIRNAAATASRGPIIERTSRNTAATPATPKSTLTSRPDVTVSPVSSITAAMGSRKRLGRLVDGTKTGAAPGDCWICLAWNRLSASSYQRPAGRSSSWYSLIRAARSRTRPISPQMQRERRPMETSGPSLARRRSAVQRFSKLGSARSRSTTEAPYAYHATVFGGPCANPQVAAKRAARDSPTAAAPMARSLSRSQPRRDVAPVDVGVDEGPTEGRREDGRWAAA